MNKIVEIQKPESIFENNVDQLKIKGKGPIAIAILLEASNGKILLQLRDNKEEIHYPNQWSIFTGGLEQDDWKGNLDSSLRYGIFRELSEELKVITEKGEVPFIPKNITLIDEGNYFDESENYFDYQYTFYAKLDIPFDKLRLKEGQRIRLFGEQETKNLKIAPSYKKIIEKFFKNRKLSLYNF